jgi:hypothetical protein
MLFPNMPSMRPAVLFLIFNRPDTTSRVFEAIRKARPERLYIAADGPRPDREGEAARCEEARKIATAVDWPCRVETLFRDENLGCKRAVSQAISWFFACEPEGVILEDDCLPHETFFDYCAHLLDRYRDSSQVMSISGSCFARRLFPAADYGFTYYADMWGWASWRRAWAHYDPEMSSWRANKDALSRFFAHNPASADYWAYFFDETAAGIRNTWDLQWQWAVIEQNGLCVTPYRNFIDNLGIRPDATHTVDSDWYITARKLEGIKGALKHPQKIARDLMLERDIAVTRFRIPRQTYRDRLLGRLRRAILNRTTYSGRMLPNRLY